MSAITSPIAWLDLYEETERERTRGTADEHMRLQSEIVEQIRAGAGLGALEELVSKLTDMRL